MALVATKATNNTGSAIVAVSQDATIGIFPLTLTRQVKGGYAPAKAINLVPQMTMNTIPEGRAYSINATRSPSRESQAFYAFDKRQTNSWTSDVYAWTTPDNNGWIAYRFTSQKRVLQYAITSAYYPAPLNFTLEGSNDAGDTAINWTVLDQRSNQSGWSLATNYNPPFERRVFDVANPGDYRHYRLNIQLNNYPQPNNLDCSIHELELLAPDPDATGAWLVFSSGTAEVKDAAGYPRLPNGPYSLRLVSLDGSTATLAAYDTSRNQARLVITWTINGNPSPPPAGSYLQIVDANNGAQITYPMPDGEIFVNISTLTDGVHQVYLKTADGTIYSQSTVKTKGGKAYNRLTDNFSHALAQSTETVTVATRDAWPLAGDVRRFQVTFGGTWSGAADVYQDFTVEDPAVSYFWRFANDAASPIFTVWPGADQQLVSPSAGTLTIRPDMAAPAAGGQDDVDIHEDAPPPQAPDPAGSFTAALMSANEAQFAWQHSGANLSGFRIYEVPAGNPVEVTPPGGLPADARSFNLMSPSYGATYRIVAFNGVGDSANNPTAALPALQGVVAAPTTMQMEIGETLPIAVTANFAGGQSFLVTSMASFSVVSQGSGGPGSINVTNAGIVQALAATQSAIAQAQFRGFMAQVAVNVAPAGPPQPPVIVYDQPAQRIHWSAVQNANQYKLYRNGDEQITTAQLEFLIPVEGSGPLWPPGTYTVMVRSVGDGGMSDLSNPVQVVIPVLTVYAPPPNPAYRFVERPFWPPAPQDPNQTEDQPFRIRPRLPVQEEDVSEPEVKNVIPRFPAPDPILNGQGVTRSQDLEES